MDKIVLDESTINRLGRNFQCYQIRWLYDMNNDQIYIIDYVAREGLIERKVVIKNIYFTDESLSVLGTADYEEVFNLTEIDVQVNTQEGTSGDPDVANKVCFMYTHAAKKAGWFDEVMLIVWGPSALLLAEDSDLQEKVRKMKEDGIILKACITCANSYQVTDKLTQLGIEVIPMGVPLTEIIKSDWHLITF